ncbi:hypothetical protein CBS63078_9686 [Aspergillus niger]|nr:hypothetical protein CBS13152_5319 [Aspergillus niger]KAI2891554.1 hypothetical protein CBS63078_9686 [Aspergillus niger]KAI2949113.1 hypothetical protein CBS147323_10922 [Aspergillus niger]KAI3014772.1 hypothetical protein CBS147345_5161 [Aspergillus niger]KAI3021672.1 hypothetical protein CBS147347_7844 [Aspergillus niger]
MAPSNKQKRGHPKSKPSSSKRRKTAKAGPEAPDQSEEADPQSTIPSQAQPASPVHSSSSDLSYKIYDGLDRYGDLEPSGIIVDVELPADIKEYADITVLSISRLRNAEQGGIESFQEQIAEVNSRRSMHHEWVGLIHKAILRLKLENSISFTTVEDKDLTSQKDWHADIQPKLLQSPEYISRPDICVGLRELQIREVLYHKSDDAVAEEFWNKLKIDGGVISDPFAKPQYLRFPFFIVEVRSDTAGDDLRQAQNRAAVGASRALWMLQMLSANRREAKSAKPKKGFDITNLPVFSLVSDGATFQLWVHYRNLIPGESVDKMEYCSAHLKSWHATSEKACSKILKSIYAILRWGVGEYKSKVAEALKSFV